MRLSTALACGGGAMPSLAMSVVTIETYGARERLERKMLAKLATDHRRLERRRASMEGTRPAKQAIALRSKPQGRPALKKRGRV